MPCVCCMSMCVCVAAGSRRQSLSKSWLLLKGQLSPAQPIYLPPPPAPIPGWRAHEESEAVWITVFPWLGDQDEIILVKPRSPRYHWIIWLFPPWRELFKAFSLPFFIIFLSFCYSSNTCTKITVTKLNTFNLYIWCKWVKWHQYLLSRSIFTGATT